MAKKLKFIQRESNTELANGRFSIQLYVLVAKSLEAFKNMHILYIQ